MTIDFYDGSNFDGLFNLLGKAFHAQKTINVARSTTIPTELDDVVEALNLLTVDAEYSLAGQPLQSLATSVRTAANSEMSALANYAASLIITAVNKDNPQPQRDISTALRELVRQMVANSQSVDASTVTAAVTPGGSNTGTGLIVASIKRGDGLINENMIAENVAGLATSDGDTASITLRGASRVAPLSADYPKGSGASASISAVSAANSLLANGDFEDEDDVANAPDDWIVSVGVIGTTVKMTDVEVQTVAIGGTPTSGYYRLLYTNALGDVQITGQIAYNATAATVQSALRQLTGLSQVTVTATGTTPNFTHTITFVGRGGNITELTSVSSLAGGTPTITHGTTSAGTAQVYAGGKALIIDSDGAELTTFNQRLFGLNPETAYAFSMWAIADVVPAAGVITVDLVDGIGGTVIADSAGTNNTFSFDCDDLSDSAWQHVTTLVGGECVFRTPLVVPDVVYLRIRVSTAVSDTTSVFLDHAALTPMTAVYPGGPLVAAFSGNVGFRRGDVWTLAVTNNRAGELQEYFERNFGMSSLGLLLPSNAANSETIPDSVIG